MQCDMFGQAGEWWYRYCDGLLLRPLRIVDGSVSRNATLSVVLLWLSISSEKRCVVYCSVNSGPSFYFYSKASLHGHSLSEEQAATQMWAGFVTVGNSVVKTNQAKNNSMCF